jgi:lipoprotein-anchoring transpeptidase ErfK/SrfK
MGLSKPHYGIHGTNNPSSIGKDVSHGCIRMYNHDVLDLSSKAPVGTKVFIHK